MEEMRKLGDLALKLERYRYNIDFSGFAIGWKWQYAYISWSSPNFLNMTQLRASYTTP